MGNHVFLVDGSSFIFKAFHALPPLTRKSDGLPIGAVAGFCNTIWKLRQDPPIRRAPTHLAVIFDTAAPTFRNHLCADYKSNRPPPPEDLVHQFALARAACKAFGIPAIELDGFEADDLIASYAQLVGETGGKVVIFGNDKDLMQLITDQVQMYDLSRRKLIDANHVGEKYGVPPELFVDLQGLMGDPTDNIPGVPGVGQKTAASLLNEFGTFDSVLDRAGEIKQPKRRQALLDHADDARLSRTLARLKRDAPLPLPLESLTICEPEPASVFGFLHAMELSQLTGRAGVALGANPGDYPANPEFAPKPTAGMEATEATSATPRTPQQLAALRKARFRSDVIDRSTYQCISELSELERWIALARRSGIVAIDTETTSLNSMNAKLLGVSLAVAPEGAHGPVMAAYIPLHNERSPADTGDAAELSLSLPVSAQPVKKLPAKNVPSRRLPETLLSKDDVLPRLKPLLESGSVLKVGQNIKYDANVLARYDINLCTFDDTMLMSYVLAEGDGSHGLDALAERHLNHRTIRFSEITADQSAPVSFENVPLATQIEYAAEDADVTLRLFFLLKPDLIAKRLLRVYETLERPLILVLSKMERRGICVDSDVLNRLSGQFGERMGILHQEILALAGQPFNPASPKQLGEILFNVMNLPGGKRTKTGGFSTDASVLARLAADGHRLPKKVLDWRQLQKLRSTYTDALQEAIDPRTHRIHTSFVMAATNTGRLASQNPNLQNIPIRSPEGQQIREAFISPPGRVLLCADYSQIELRILAHLAEVPALRQAFEDNIDIHTLTARIVFKLSDQEVDATLRRRAKAINFGIIYGISAFGLSNQLGISRSEAQGTINDYFERFPGILDYMESIKTSSRDLGFVETIFGRRIYFPGIRSRNANERAFNERAAINAPIQGSAADIIRQAMIRVEDELTGLRSPSRLLLQIHDELVLETDVDLGSELADRVKICMESAAVLRVPITVDVGLGINWSAAH